MELYRGTTGLGFSGPGQLGTLRKILVASLGRDRAKNLLVRYGWLCGHDVAVGTWGHLYFNLDHEWRMVADALQSLKSSVRPLAAAVADTTIVSGEPITLRFRASYEAAQHVHYLGVSEHPVCWSLVGFAGGYASALFERKILFAESECIGKGDSYCEIIGKPVEEWGEEIRAELPYYEEGYYDTVTAEAYKRLKDQHVCLEKHFNLHRRLTEHVLNGEGVAGISQTVSRLVNGTVFVFDNRLHLLRYDSPDVAEPPDRMNQMMKKSVLDHLEGILLHQKDSDDYSTLVAKKAPLKHAVNTDGRRFAVLTMPIVAVGEILGFVSVVWDSEKEVDGDAVAAVQGAANVYALEMIKQKEISTIEQQFTWDFVEALFSKKYASEESLIEWGLRLGHDIRKPHRIIVMGVESGDSSGTRPEEGTLLLRKEIFRAASMYLKRLYPSVFLADVKGRIVLFIPDATTDKGALRRLISGLKDRIEHHFPKTAVSYGVGGIARRCDEYFNCYLQAKKAHIILKSYGKKDWVLFFEDLGSLSVLLEADNKQELVEFMKRKLGPLLEHDRQHNSELVNSLEQYLSTSTIWKAAKMMSLSVSGLKYRLNKIKEFGYDLQSPQERFDLQLALQILRITEQCRIPFLDHTAAAE
ncbi:MAG: helix-turn-helix domain-containing protein [Bacillota bacterium]|nr:helix-turn-helix domain-containing protein [Bacillota bacterium]